MNTLNFKTYKEYVTDKKNKILEQMDNEEKLEIYNKYCENSNDYDSMLYKNNDEFLEYVFGDNLKLSNSVLAKAIECGDYKYSDEYITFDRQGDLHSYYSLHDALENKFVDSNLIDFTMDYINVDFEDLYNTYVRNIIEDAKESMLLKDFLNALKEYLIDDMKEKYPVVYNNIYYGYSYYTPYTTNKKDLKEGNVKLKVKGLKGNKLLRTIYKKL